MFFANGRGRMKKKNYIHKKMGNRLNILRTLSFFSVVACLAVFLGCEEELKKSPFAFLSSSSVEQVVESSSSSEKVVEPVVVESSSSLPSSSSQEVQPPKPVVKPAPVEVPKPVNLCANAPKEALCDKRDGRIYKTVLIGSQEWMAENMNYESAGSYCYGDRAENCDNYGRLYKWNVALGLAESYQTKSAKSLLEKRVRGICPEGWHVPQPKEMSTLYSAIRQKLKKSDGEYIEGVGTSLKKKTGWTEGEEAPSGTDRFGFGGVPGGYRNVSGSFNYLGQDCNFWVAAESSEPDHAPYWNLYFDNEDFLGSYSNVKNSAYSVRCIKD